MGLVYNKQFNISSLVSPQLALIKLKSIRPACYLISRTVISSLLEKRMKKKSFRDRLLHRRGAEFQRCIQEHLEYDD
jgi:hypothetical protein